MASSSRPDTCLIKCLKLPKFYTQLHIWFFRGSSHACQLKYSWCRGLMGAICQSKQVLSMLTNQSFLRCLQLQVEVTLSSFSISSSARKAKMGDFDFQHPQTCQYDSSSAICQGGSQHMERGN